MLCQKAKYGLLDIVRSESKKHALFANNDDLDNHFLSEDDSDILHNLNITININNIQ